MPVLATNSRKQLYTRIYMNLLKLLIFDAYYMCLYALNYSSRNHINWTDISAWLLT